MEHRPDIDGLRAVAVLPVLFFHANLGCFGGYVGVDVFFVISGYLITSMIVHDVEAQQFSLLGFWERRIRRILPALFGMILVSFVVATAIFLPLDFKELGQSVVAQSLLLSNVYFWRESGYFAQPAELRPLLHTWSLAVEEQFYLLLPLFLISIKQCSRRVLLTSLVLLSAVSFLVSVYGSYRSPSAAFYLLPYRAWELLIGSTVAMLTMGTGKRDARWSDELLSISGLIAILSAVILYDKGTRFPGFAALLPCGGAAIIIWANGGRLTSVGRILASRPLVSIGLISYSLYLWHWPLLTFLRYLMPNSVPVLGRIGVLVVSAALAVLSWKFIERPFRRRAVVNSRGRVFAFGGIAAVSLFVIGLIAHLSKGMPIRLPPQVQRFVQGSTDRPFQREIGLREVSLGKFVELGRGNKAQPISLFVWGDSHAMAVMPVLDHLCRQYDIRGVAATHSSTAPLLGYVNRGAYSLKDDVTQFNDLIIAFIHSNRIPNVLLIANWYMYVSDVAGDKRAERAHAAFLRTVSTVADSGVMLWVMRQVPEQEWDVPRALASAVLFGSDSEKLGLPLWKHRNKMRCEEALFQGVDASRVTILDPSKFFITGEGVCGVAKDGKALYYDNHHLSVSGAMVLRPLFEPLFEQTDRQRVRVEDERSRISKHLTGQQP